MCGIAGIIDARLSRDDLERVLRGFEVSLQHRGPDDRGFFVSSQGDAGLVNTRLAILDLPPAGNQPMTSVRDRFTITSEGEIYNYAALRAELLADSGQLRSHSDTEVVLELFARDGAEALRKLEGMFAMAIRDGQERSLFLARDQLGIKPLYYHEKGGRFLFGSELRTLLNSGLVPRELSALALAGYLASGSVPEPLTLVPDVRVLPAGHYLEIKDGRSSLTKFWEIQFAKGHCDQAEAVRRTRGALDDSIRRHHVSDVPVGIFLSGGIDSTAVLASPRRARSGICGRSRSLSMIRSLTKARWRNGPRNISVRTIPIGGWRRRRRVNFWKSSWRDPISRAWTGSIPSAARSWRTIRA